MRRLGGGPPSNWDSTFRRVGVDLGRATEQFYLHSFYPEQPDLNWRNPEVAEAIAEVMRFWFRRGVDGFRVDAIFAAIKDELLRDNPPGARAHHIPGFGGEDGAIDPLWSMNRPEVHDVIRQLRRVADEFPGRVLVARRTCRSRSWPSISVSGRDDEFHLAFDFELLHSPWDHRHLALAIERAEALPPARHPADLRDLEPRPVAPRHALGRAAHPRRGVPAPHAARRRGALRRRGDRDGRRRRSGPAPDRRSTVRTRRRANADAMGCLSTGRVHHRRALAATRRSRRRATSPTRPADPASLLALYRRLIAARRASPALRRGTHRSLFGVAPEVLAWVREAAGERVLVLLNVGDEARACDLRALPGATGEVVVGTGDARRARSRSTDLVLEPLEGFALRL